MTTDRPYRRGMRRDEAMARIRAGRGSQFCPVCVDALDAVLTLEVPEADREAALSTACGEPGGDFTRP
jgi:HD-GYP domain-containing protein (c-di-GMP phosphodiesterase class II)